MRAEVEGDRLDADELFAMSVLILVAGHETTTNLIGNAVLALLRHPDQRRRLTADPGLMRTAVEEFLRFDGVVQATARIALEDVSIGGVAIPKGEGAILVIGAANRDPAQFEDPDRLDVARADNRHLAFGYGPHFCLGAGLARAEAQLALAASARARAALRRRRLPPGLEAHHGAARAALASALARRLKACPAPW